MRLSLITGLLAAVASATVADPVPLVDVTPALAAKVTAGRLDYHVYSSAERPEQLDVTYTMLTAVTPDTIVLYDTMIRGGSTNFSATLTCRRDNYLNPQTVDLRMGRRGQAQCRVENGRLSMTMDGRSAEAAFPTNLITQSALYRLVPHLPTTPGMAIVAEAFSEIPEFRPPRDAKPYTITCTGPEARTLDGLRIATQRYEIRGGRKMDMWVADGRMVHLFDHAGLFMTLLSERHGATPSPTAP